MYKSFSKIYDELMTSQFDYGYIFSNIVKICEKYGCNLQKTLECGVGSGNLAEKFLESGVSVDGYDLSNEMIDIARDKLEKFEKLGKLKLFNGDIKSFLNDEKYDLIYSFFDVLNYVNRIEYIESFIKNSHSMMNEKSLLMFDVNSEYKLRKYLGNNDFICEEGDIFYTWKNHLAPRHIDFDINFFVPMGDDNFKRIREKQRQYIYKKEQVVEILENNGFEILEIMDFEKFKDLQEKSFRILFVAKKR